MPRPVHLHGGGQDRGRRAAGRRSRSAAARQRHPPDRPDRHPVRAGRTGSLRRAVLRRGARRRYADHVDGSPRWSTARRTRSWPCWPRRLERLAQRRAVRPRRPPPAIGWPCWPTRSTDGSGWARSPGSPSWSPPGRTGRAAGSSRSSDTAGWPPPARAAARHRPDAGGRPAGGLRRDGAGPAAGRCPVRPPRRPPRCCAGWNGQGTRLVRSTDAVVRSGARRRALAPFVAAAATARSQFRDEDLLAGRGSDAAWSDVLDDRSNWRGRTPVPVSRTVAG